jgi:putative ubiquitin-RnfH superfamily antitoxin RatB of RatAB toxin-antitoxin module
MRCIVTNETFEVEVAYATPEEQVILPLQIRQGATLIEAVERSGIVGQFPEIDIEKARVGIFGKVAKKDAPLSPGDRVEIYRPLIADPKEARKKRAAEGKQMKKGGGAQKTEDRGQRTGD